MISPDHLYLKNAEFVHELHRLGFRVVTWTVNDPKRWAELIEMGVDGIISDYPEDLLHFLKKQKLR